MTIKSISSFLSRECRIYVCRAHRGMYVLYKDAEEIGIMYSHLSDWGGVRFRFSCQGGCSEYVRGMAQLRDLFRFMIIR